MKLLLTTVLILGLLTFTGCNDTSEPDPATGPAPTTDLHGENDGHDHGAEAGKSEAEGEDHSDHDH